MKNQTKISWFKNPYTIAWTIEIIILLVLFACGWTHIKDFKTITTRTHIGLGIIEITFIVAFIINTISLVKKRRENKGKEVNGTNPK